MRVTVTCEGGPAEYAGRVWDDLEADDGGYVLLPRPGEHGPEAWYQLDPQTVAPSRVDGAAQQARYVADYLPS
ncbi:MAG: hypothetical protein H0V48_07890 [Nocardioidaceae bacterium]|nr:hypothetical protein [Nocardioidaceae bacterium]MDQ3164796.1 hypothetical protein [Actinomycetota bacterium]